MLSRMTRATLILAALLSLVACVDSPNVTVEQTDPLVTCDCRNAKPSYLCAQVCEGTCESDECDVVSVVLE